MCTQSANRSTIVRRACITLLCRAVPFFTVTSSLLVGSVLAPSLTV